MNHLRWSLTATLLLLLIASVARAQSPEGDKADLLTRNEREWLAEHPEIRIAPDPDFPPTEYFDEDGKYRGISADYIALMEIKLGIKFKIVHLDNWDKVLEQAKSRQVDMFGAAVQSVQRSEYMLFTRPYLNFPAVIIVRESVKKTLTLKKLRNMKVAVVSSYATHEYVAYNYPELDLDVVPDVQTGLRKVSFGMVDAFVGNLATATYYINEEGITNLRMSGESGHAYELAFASRKDWPILNQILEKGLAQISEEDRKEIYNRWIHLEQLTPDLWKKYMVPIFIGLGAIVSIIAGIVVWNRLLKKQIAHRKQAEEVHLAHLRFFESMERIDQAIREETDHDKMLRNVIDTVFSVFSCDRAWLLYPCDPDAPSFRVPMEFSSPDYPGALALNKDVPMTPSAVRDCREALAADGPIPYGPGCEKPVSGDTAKRFSIQAQMFMAIYPKVGKPWLFGMHQCTYARVWTKKEQRLFKEIGRRISDGLSSLLFLRDLQKSEERFRTLVANIPGIVYRSKNDPDRTIVYISDGIEAAAGYPASEFVGDRFRSFSSIMHPDDCERFWQIVQDALKQGKPYEIEYRINNANGNIHWMLERGQGVIGKDGQLDYLDGALFDMTRRKHAEEELKNHREHLEELVTERTGELEKKAQELEEAYLRLQEADRLKSVFLASVSHELRTPLNAIIGFTGIIMQGMAGEINEEQEKQLTVVKNSADSLLHLVQEVLDIAEIEAGRAELSVETFALDDVVREVEEAYSPTVKETGLEFKYDAPEGITLESDRTRLKQILMNLVSNAVKFTDRGDVKVSAKSSDDDSLEICVIDTGIGIKTEDMDKLFQPFRQIDLSHKKRHEGTGLGLHHTRKLAELLGGGISVKSEFGKGSEFIFTIPLKPKEV